MAKRDRRHIWHWFQQQAQWGAFALVLVLGLLAPLGSILHAETHHRDEQHTVVELPADWQSGVVTNGVESDHTVHDDCATCHALGTYLLTAPPSPSLVHDAILLGSILLLLIAFVRRRWTIQTTAPPGCGYHPSLRPPLLPSH